jgi:hypothetical protein
MSSKTNMYNIGTTICFDGDDSNRGGFGTITSTQINALGEVEFEVTFQDGRVFPEVTEQEFEVPGAAFHMVDAEEAKLWDMGAYETEEGWYAEVDAEGWDGLIGEVEFYHSELSPMVEHMR